MNTRFYRNSAMQQNAGWRELLKGIQAEKAEYNEYFHIMTPYERSAIEREMKAHVESSHPAIASGILGEYSQAIEKYQDARRAHDREVAKEINRWESTRFNAELDIYKKRVELIGEGDITGAIFGGVDRRAKLEELYNEAKASGDSHKMRAACEVIAACKPTDGPDNAKFAINSLAKLAGRELSEMRQTEGMAQSRQGIDEAWNSFLNIKDELIQVAQVLGEGDPTGVFASGNFARAIRKVQRDEQTGEIVIYPDDHPEVTGVLMVDKSEMKSAR